VKSDYLNTWPAVKSKFSGRWIESELTKRQFKSTQVLLDRLKSSSANPCKYDYYLGEIFRKQGGKKNAQKAISYYLKHLEQCLTSPVIDTYKRMADSYLELGNSDKARFYYTKYINLFPQPRDAKMIRTELANL
jgi:tetratricopeptide (TPR) repeat protein